MDSSARHLVFNAAVVLLIGLLYGAPYARAIKRNAPAQVINSWRVAHQSIPVGAILMFAIGALLPSFSVGPQIKWLIAASLIVSSYAFCISTPLAAMTGHRGLSLGGKGLARLVFVGNIIGAWTSMIASALIIYAAAVSL